MERTLVSTVRPQPKDGVNPFWRHTASQGALKRRGVGVLSQERAAGSEQRRSVP